ncbi:MAG: DUF4438 domain-containing protein [Halanaerobiales bacterium]
MEINKKDLVMQSVQGSISHPLTSSYAINREGEVRVLPGTGGITYNVKVGDPAFGLAGDHIEPGVSMKIDDNRRKNGSLNFLVCIGNTAKVVGGEAEDAEGYVTGTHGGINHILINFKKEDLEEMKIGDDILIKAYGQGLELEDYPEIKCYNLSPRLLNKMNIKENKGKLGVPVTASIPGHLMGSGIGSATSASGDYDITTGNDKEIKKLGIDKLKLGDIVYLDNCDNTYGREYKEGAGTIGIVIHSDCIRMGHGPGVTALMTSKEDVLEPVIDEKANISNYLEL